MYPDSIPDIIIQAQAVLKLFCWQDCFTIQNALLYKNAKLEKGDYSAKYLQNFVKS